MRSMKLIRLPNGAVGYHVNGELFSVGAPPVDYERAASGLCGALCSPPCDRKAFARGLCRRHYKRWYEGLDVSSPIGRPGGSNHGTPTSGTCIVEGCGKPRKAKGMCSMHYSRSRRGTDIDAPARRSPTPPGSRCSLCGRPSFRGDLCSMHSARKYRKIPMDLPRMDKRTGGVLRKLGMNAAEADRLGILGRIVEGDVSNLEDIHGQAYDH